MILAWKAKEKIRGGEKKESVDSIRRKKGEKKTNSCGNPFLFELCISRELAKIPEPENKKNIYELRKDFQTPDPRGL